VILVGTDDHWFYIDGERIVSYPQVPVPGPLVDPQETTLANEEGEPLFGIYRGKFINDESMATPGDIRNHATLWFRGTHRYSSVSGGAGAVYVNLETEKLKDGEGKAVDMSDAVKDGSQDFFLDGMVVMNTKTGRIREVSIHEALFDKKFKKLISGSALA
jgi:hypothetical protein